MTRSFFRVNIITEEINRLHLLILIRHCLRNASCPSDAGSDNKKKKPKPRVSRKGDNSEIDKEMRNGMHPTKSVFQGGRFSHLESLLQTSEEQLKDTKMWFPEELISVFLADYNFIFTELSGSSASSVSTKYISV